MKHHATMTAQYGATPTFRAINEASGMCDVGRKAKFLPVTSSKNDVPFVNHGGFNVL